jgi:hypothetical protein
MSAKSRGQIISQGPSKGQAYVVDVDAGKTYTGVTWRWLLENPQHTMEW